MKRNTLFRICVAVLICVPLYWISLKANIAVPVIATSGGIILLIGLVMEEFDEREWHNTVKHFRRAGWLAKIGRQLVILGVGVEIATGAGLTTKSTMEFAENSKLNAPINSISATVGLKVRGASSSLFSDGWGIFEPPTNDEEAMSKYAGGSITFFERTNLQSSIYELTRDGLTGDGENMKLLASGVIGESNDTRGVIVHFNDTDLKDFEFFQTRQPESTRQVRSFNNVGGIVISLPKMRSNIVVMSGAVELRVNSSMWKFPIPQQKPQDGFIISSQIVTNAANNLEGKLWPSVLPQKARPQ